MNWASPVCVNCKPLCIPVVILKNTSLMKRIAGISIIFIVLFQVASCTQPKNNNALHENYTLMNQHLDTITLGAGCFWCVEAIFQQLKGVYSVESGYSGGSVKNPSYKEVCTGTTGHAEVCQITYDTQEISFTEILEVFWKTHDPTTPDRQGGDIGPQYRSAVFYHNNEQKKLAEEMKAKLDAAGVWDDPMVTEVTAFTV